LLKFLRSLFQENSIKNMKTNLILFGPPGSGKGTQAKKLAAKYNLIHISTGDLFRYEMKNDTPLGLEAKSYIAKGDLVPDSVTIGMLTNKVDANLDAKGFIFDGFPRNVFQSEALDNLLSKRSIGVNKLISLDVSEDEIVKRILERGKSSGRADDLDESIIRNRISVYHSETKPVYDFYDTQSKSVTVSGMGDIDEIFARLCDQVDQEAN